MHSFTVHIEGGENSVVEAQVVQASLGMSLQAVLDEIYNLNLEGRLRADALIVRLPVEQAWSLEEIQSRSTDRAKELFAISSDGSTGVFERAKDRSVHILSSYAGQHVLTPNISPHWQDDPLETRGISAAAAIAAIKASEFEYILDQSRAILTCPSGSLYLAPSGRLVRSFVRVGNIQYCRDAIDALFFWLLPYLSTVGAILTDTWSISSIAFNVAKLCAIYFGGEPRRVEMLPEYHDGGRDADRHARAVVERLDADWAVAQGENDVLLCLISATQTGSLSTRLTKIFETSSIALRPRFVAIFKLGDSDIESMHDLSQDPRFILMDTEEESAGEPVQIDSRVYFPLQFEDTIFELNKPLADRSRGFFDRYCGAGLIEVHRTHDDRAGRPRHHMIHLTTERLLDQAAFEAAFLARLDALATTPNVIVSPPHVAGVRLAQRAARHFAEKGAQCRIYAHPNLYFAQDLASDEERRLRKELQEAEEEQSFLILDDVCITGTRLSQYQRYIRSERFKGRIDYLVGVARPQNPKTWTDLQRNLKFRAGNRPTHTVNAVEYLLLPDWRDDDCPWCNEKRLYERWARGVPLPPLLVERLELLSRSISSGLTDDLFLSIPGLPKLKLGPDSLFTQERANQAEVFAAVAAALQYLRCEATGHRPLLGRRHFPISTVLKHEDYLRSKWTDSILRATFLRAAVSDELTYADAQSEGRRIATLKELLIQEAEGEHDIALEILLAANLGKCRIDVGEGLAERLQSFGAPEAVSYLMERMDERQHRR